MYINRFAVVCFAVLVALGCMALTEGAEAACRIDWNNDGEVTESDYLVGDPIGGFYAEWYIFLYYPTYYPILFPGGDSSALDFDINGSIDDQDLMGPLDAAQMTEGFYVEWYIYMFYQAYYGIFIPESTCPPPGVRESVPLTGGNLYLDMSDALFYEISRNGEFIGGVDYLTGQGFVVATQDVIDNPTSKATFEYMGDKNIVEVIEFSNDNKIVAAIVDVVVDGTEMWGGALYDRDAGTWTIVPEPQQGVDWAACRFYPNIGGMSSDGRYVGGFTATLESACRPTAYIYDTVLDAFTLMPKVEENQSQDVHDISADGTKMVGYEQRDPVVVDGVVLQYGGRAPVIWTKQADGTWTVNRMDETGLGESYNITYNGKSYVAKVEQDAMLYGPAGVTNIGRISADYGARANGLADDARFAVGTHPAGLGNVDPFVWRAGHGIEGFEDYLASEGAPVGINFNPGSFVPRSVSSDGKIIVGLSSGLGVQYGFLVVTTPF